MFNFLVFSGFYLIRKSSFPLGDSIYSIVESNVGIQLIRYVGSRAFEAFGVVFWGRITWHYWLLEIRFWSESSVALMNLF